jgi:hypothetical protein
LRGAGRFLPALEKELNAMLGLKTWVLPAHDKQLDSFNVWRQAPRHPSGPPFMKPYHWLFCPLFYRSSA